MNNESGKNKNALLEKSKEFFWILAIFLFPAIIAYLTIDGYQQQTLSIKQKEQENAADLAMAKLNREMHLESVVDKALKKFKAFSENLAKTAQAKEELVKKLDQEFFRVFPESSLLLWFDRRFRLIPSKSSKMLEKRTTWQRFMLVISAPEKAKRLDKKIANGFVKSEMSDFLSTDFFRNLYSAPIEILFGKERVLMRSMKLDSGKQHLLPPQFLALIPVGRARKDWLENRALKILSQSDQRTGAFRFSSQTPIKESSVSASLLPRFAQMFKSGALSAKAGNWHYYFSYHFENPDIFLCVGLPNRNNQMLNLVFAVLKFLAFLPFSTIVVLKIFSEKYYLLPGLSLRTRFRLATAGLTISPIIIMCFSGLLYLDRISVESEQMRLDKLENSISSYGDSITMQTSQLESFLRNELNDQLKIFPPGKEMSEKAFSLLKNSGCHLAMVLSKKGKIFHTTSFDESTAKNRMSFFIGMIKTPLINEGFNVEKIEKQISSVLGKSFSAYRDKKFRYDFYNRLNTIELGPTVANLFNCFVRNKRNEIVACVGLGFDDETMRQFFLQKALKKKHNDETRVFLRPLNFTGTYFTPNSPRVKEILELTALTGNTIESRFKWHKDEYIVRSRLLKNSLTAAAAVMKIESKEDDPGLIFLALLATISLLAAMQSQIIFVVFEKAFLQPIFALTSAVNLIRGGDYHISFPHFDNDEIGRLEQSFCQMAGGLREKAEMKKYLNADLYSNNERQTEFSRSSGAVMFCGIRNFVQLEEKLTAEESFNLMNLFLAICDQEVSQQGGKIDKFIGDTAMAFFRGEESSVTAVSAALNIKEKLDLELKGIKTPFCYGIGIAAGELIAGQIGSKNKRLDYTVIGDTVNLAARLEKLAGRDGRPQILIPAQPIFKQEFKTAEFATLKVKGKANLVEIDEIVGELK